MSLYNIELEQSVLNTLMTLDNAFDQLNTELNKDFFYAPRHQELFEIITTLKDSGMPYDFVMVHEHINTNKKELVTGGDEYLATLMENTVGTQFNLNHYVDRLHDLSQRRAMNQKFLDAQKLINDTNIDPVDVWSEVAEGVNQVMQGAKGDDFHSVGELFDDYLRELEKNAMEGFKPSIKTGLIELDNKVMLNKGDMMVIAARPSMGKTTLAQNILRNIAETEEGRAVFFSVEMAKEGIIKRMVSSTMNVRMDKVFTNQRLNTKDWDNIHARHEYIKSLPLTINDTSGITLGKMRAVLNRIRQKYGKVSAIMVDYLQLMSPPNPKDSREQQISKISAGLKGLAKEFDCPMIALAQLNRSLENRPDKRPVMSDLRDSGSIEQDADQIIFIYRDAVYNKTKPDPMKKAIAIVDNKPVDKKPADDFAELIVAKQRNGEIGMVPATFEGEYSRFTNWIPRPDDDFAYGAQQ